MKKKIIVSLILTVFIFCIFYPSIYAAENIIINTVEENSKNETESENVENEVEENNNLKKKEENVTENTTVENLTTIEIIESETTSGETEQENNKVTINADDLDLTAKSHTGKMYIETPTNQQLCILPNASNLTIKGWAVSTDLQATLKLYLDNTFIQDINNRSSRGDVDKTVSPSYGGTVSTPKAGFNTILDISKLSIGTHTVKIEQLSNDGKILCTDSRNLNVKHTKYTGKMYIETPSNNQAFLLPNSNIINVKGWAVSGDSEATLKLYVNNKFVKNVENRTSRGDVNKTISPSYGGTANTPKAGFNTTLDVTTFSEGTYKVRIEQVSRYGNVICKDEKTIKINQTRYTGKMYIETPTNNQSYTLPNTNTLNIKGWAVSGDRNAVLNLYVNNKLVKKITKRNKRTDVDKSVSPSYGGTAATPYAGFETSLDISSYAEGIHNIKIEEVSRFGIVICSASTKIRIGQMKYTGKMNIESFPVLTYSLPDNNTMNIFGWAVSNDTNSYMKVTIDGKDYKYTIKRNKRTDVDKGVSPSYGGTASTPKAGFSINVNISDLHEGNHTVVVSEMSRYNKVLASAKVQLKVITPNYTGLMNIESPIANKRYTSGWLEVKGWAITECSGDFMKVYLDEQFQAVAQATKREDVIAVYGNKYPKHNEYAGFISNVNTSNLAEGMHTVKIQHCSRYGKVIQEKAIQFMISNTTTWGIDVSHHQGNIDWNTVKNQGVNFAILKIGEYRESSGRIIKDEHFEQYYAECKRLGIAVGGYFYSYAFNPQEAANEANACLSVIKGKSFEMPIFFDIEDHIVTNAVNNGTTNRDNLTNAAITFCDILNANGYKSGVYSYRNFFYSYLNMPVLEKYNIWLAHYVATTDYTGKYDMWQYTSSGSMPGITGAVDLNWCFRRYY